MMGFENRLNLSLYYQVLAVACIGLGIALIAIDCSTRGGQLIASALIAIYLVAAIAPAFWLAGKAAWQAWQKRRNGENLEALLEGEKKSARNLWELAQSLQADKSELLERNSSLQNEKRELAIRLADMEKARPELEHARKSHAAIEYELELAKASLQRLTRKLTMAEAQAAKAQADKDLLGERLGIAIEQRDSNYGLCESWRQKARREERKVDILREAMRNARSAFANGMICMQALVDSQRKRGAEAKLAKARARVKRMVNLLINRNGWRQFPAGEGDSFEADTEDAAAKLAALQHELDEAEQYADELQIQRDDLQNAFDDLRMDHAECKEANAEMRELIMSLYKSGGLDALIDVKVRDAMRKRDEDRYLR